MVDVVIFHQIFQTHHLLSGIYDPYTYDGVRTNVMFDGLFTALMLAIAAVGVAMLWRVANGTAERLSTRFLVGSVVIGAGVFNVFDGIVDHYVLDIHNVLHGTEAWNPHWVVVSVVMLLVGAVLLYTADGYSTGMRTADRT